MEETKQAKTKSPGKSSQVKTRVSKADFRAHLPAPKTQGVKRTFNEISGGK